MKGLTPSFLLSISLLFSVTNAVTLDLIGKRKQGSSLFPRRLKRDDAGVFGNGSVALHNLGDTSYQCNVTLGGKDFEVIIDTGSVDLWVKGDVPGTKDLGVPMSIDFAVGTARGNINTAQLQFDGFTIENQAYLRANFTQDLEDINGFIGLGPSSASEVVRHLQSSDGDPPLDRIFQSNTSTPNILTLLLSRNASAETMSDTIPLSDGYYPAQLTIGTTIPGLDAIASAPKLPALIDQFGKNQHWLTLLDADGIVVNGKKISTSTAIPNPTNGTADQLHVVFDSGFSFPQIPKAVMDAIYGDIPGSQFVQDGADVGLNGSTNFYSIPCDYEVNVSFFFAGQEFPVSPLDLSMFLGTTDSGEDVCISFYQQIDDNLAGNPNFGAFDMILGMGFLRNTYILINFGDFVDGSKSNVADPYIQLLSISDKTKIHQDFVNARLGGNRNGNRNGNKENSK